MKKSLVALGLTLMILSIGGGAVAGKKNKMPKNMRIYAAQCSEVIDPLRDLLEDRGFFVVDEDVADDGDIEMELARGGGFGKRSKSRGWVELNQGSGRCTVIIELQQKDPVFGRWSDTAWNEKKFYAPLDEQFPQVE